MIRWLFICFFFYIFWTSVRWCFALSSPLSDSDSRVHCGKSVGRFQNDYQLYLFPLNPSLRSRPLRFCPRGPQTPACVNGWQWGAMGGNGWQWVAMGVNGWQWMPWSIGLGGFGDWWYLVEIDGIQLRDIGCHFLAFGTDECHYTAVKSVGCPGDASDSTDVFVVLNGNRMATERKMNGIRMATESNT